MTDDEMGMRLGVLRTLRDFTVHVPDVDENVGFLIDHAESGEEALDKIRRQPPDILLLDHKMPGISGLEVLEQLAGMKTDMLTIMITAYASIETAVAATKQGAYDFLAKPFTPDELKSTIRKTAARLILAKQARKLAEEKQQVRFEFIRVLGHELKSPLNAIGGYLELMKDRQLGGESGLLRRDDRPQPRPRRRHAQVDPRPAGPHANRVRPKKPKPCRGRSGRRRPRPPSKPSRPKPPPERSPSASMPPTPFPCTADAGEIEMLLNNLLSNAVKYNRDGGSVDVTIERRDSQIVITVADTGIGMTPEEHEQIFGEFVRIKNERTSTSWAADLAFRSSRSSFNSTTAL